jgi:hypothetical protein
MSKDITKEVVHRLKNGDDFENVRWIDDEVLYAHLNDVPLIITIEVDERYQALLELEQQMHEARDKLRNMGFIMTATEADQLANDIAKLESEI